MKLSDFDYYLPKNLIAQQPVTPRDSSRLFVLNRQTGEMKHEKFYDIHKYLKSGDVLVLNNSKVIPARLVGQKKTGGKIEIFLLREIKPGIWEALLDRKVVIGDPVSFGDNFKAEVIKLPTAKQRWLVKFDYQGQEFDNLLNKYGSVPIPPYIKSEESESDKIKKQYQTIYVSDDKKGSVAAPTAGFHFMDELITRLEKKGVQFEYVTLHVGLGTFEPVRCENIEEHQMHAEYVEVDAKTLGRLKKAKKSGRRLVTVGTTSTRVLESIFSDDEGDIVEPKGAYHGWVNIFIYPGYQFKAVSAMITNFHLPKSTLLMLVSALAGKDLIKKAYQEAVSKEYRFYSFGDAMLII